MRLACSHSSTGMPSAESPPARATVCMTPVGESVQQSAESVEPSGITAIPLPAPPRDEHSLLVCCCSPAVSLVEEGGVHAVCAATSGVAPLGGEASCAF